MFLSPRPLRAAPPTDPHRERIYWSNGATRPFVAGRLETGFLQRGIVAVGYGKPHWTWIGVEAQAATTTDFGTFIGALHASAVLVDMWMGLRWTHSYAHRLLPAQARYEDAELTESARPTANLLTMDLSLNGVVPLPRSFLPWEVTYVRYLDVPSATYVFDEYLRAVVRPPAALMVRVGYLFRFFDGFYGGFAVDTVVPGARDPIVRLGPFISWRLTDHTTIDLLSTMTVVSPDNLSLFSGMGGTARIRWAFATDDPAPRFP